MKNYQKLITDFKKIKIAMSPKDQTEGQLLVQSYERGNADVADIEDLRNILKRYFGLIDMYDSRESFNIAYKNYQRTLNKLLKLI